jgi:hypothetical protein
MHGASNFLDLLRSCKARRRMLGMPFTDSRRHVDVRRRLPRDAMWVVALAYVTLFLVDLKGVGLDAHAYWQAWRGPMYTTGPMTEDAYLYSPAFAEALWPFAQLPWPAFAGVVIGAVGVSLAWLLRPLGSGWGIPLWLLGIPEILAGNIFVLLAVATVAGLRRPEAWAVAALTKITPCVGPIWFLVRREWTNLLRCLGAMLAIVGLSLALEPDLWLEWFRLLWTHAGDAGRPLGAPVGAPLAFRLPVGLALVVWGALTGRPWTLAGAMLLCSPVLWLGSLTLLAAIPRMHRADHPAEVQAVPDEVTDIEPELLER